MKKLFNDGWQFAFKPIGELPQDSDFIPVDIPHDWQIYHAKDLYSTGDGWYKKSFELDLSSEKVHSLRFEGVYMDSEVYLNGEKIFEWKYGYTTFDVPLENLKDGENELRLRVRHQNPNSRWYSGSGIYRNVWLRTTGKNRLAADGTYVVSKPNSSDLRKWTTEIDTELVCEPAGTVRHTLYDCNENVVKTCSCGFFAGTKLLSQRLELDSPALWSTDEPNLYTLVTELLIDGEVVDSRVEKIGYRHLKFDKNEGFFLNGVHMKLNGACMHHDLGALGSAVNKTALRQQLESLKEMGVNAIRTSHNPPSVELMELADEMGVMIDSEGFDMWELKKTEYDYARFFVEWHERDVRSWIRRDRNHPSVIMWSIGNEIYDTHASPHGVEITKELSRCVHIDDYKNAHPITIGSNYMMWEGAQKCAEKIDLVGYNYFERNYDDHHARFPHWVMYGSETGSTVQSRGVYHFPASVFATTYDDWQCSSLLNCSTGWGAPNTEFNITMDRNRRYSLGQFIWTGWDYIGEPTPYNTKNSYFGHVDTAGFPKDTYYAYKAEWNKKAAPFVHLYPYWDFNEGQMIDLFIFSNCHTTELFVNGESCGKHVQNHTDGDKLSGRWSVPYHRGEIKAVGYNEAGEKVCEMVRRSFSDPAEIVLKPNKTTLSADGEDMIFVEISLADKDGNPVENARNRINIELAGAARLVGMDNGDSTDYDDYKCSSRRLFNGKLLCMLAASDTAGDITLTAKSSGLPNATLKLSAVPADVREGSSCHDSIICQDRDTGVDLRKIELCVTNQVLTPENPVCEAKIKLLPENTTRTLAEICFKAITQSGVETNLADITVDGNRLDRAVIKPRGDGIYRLRAYCRQGKDFEEVISDIELENKGFGPAGYDPYGSIVSATLCRNTNDLQCAMEGGVKTFPHETSVIFGNVDFGKIGSDELTIGIYTYNEGKIPVEIWVDGNRFAEVVYQSRFVWNTYMYNTFTLPERLRGEHDLEFRFSEELRFKGFKFASPRRAEVEILAVESDRVYGDSFAIGEEMVEGIGNNVNVIFEGVDLGEGVTAVEITGRTRNAVDTVHLRFSDAEPTSVEFKGSAEITTQRFEIAKTEGIQDLNVVFLPGCDFDFKSIKFIR